MAEHVYLNGDVMPADQAKITVFDAGLQHGVGLFEVICCYHGRPFRLNDHLARLEDSAKTLGLVVPAQPKQFERAIEKLLAANELGDARVRITVTGGSVRVGIHLGAQSAPNVLITAGPAAAPPAEVYADGVGVVLSDYRVSSRDPIIRHKTISYLSRLTALKRAQQARMADALWFSDEGYLVGGSVANVFVVRDDIIHTPPLDLPVIPGIARKVVIELAADLQFPLRETRLSMQEMLEAQEMFLTNTVIEVLPVVVVERHVVGEGRVGPLTRSLLQRYRRQVREELEIA